MKYLFLHYPKCSTCIKAGKWLRDNGVEIDPRDITRQNPTREELERWTAQSGLPLKKFFNTSGLRYKELNLKEKVGVAPQQELLGLLASDGMLVKRPLLVGPDFVLVGFREEDWRNRLLGKTE